MLKRIHRRRAGRCAIPIVYAVICVAVLASAGCSRTPSAKRSGSFELKRTMDFYFLQDWVPASNGQLQPEYLLIAADSEDAQALLTGVEWEVDDCIEIVDPKVEIPPSNPRITWKSQVLQDSSVQYIVKGLRIEAEATLSATEGCTPGDYPIKLRMPALGIAAEAFDAGVYFPGKNAPEEFVPPDTLLVTTLQIQ